MKTFTSRVAGRAAKAITLGAALVLLVPAMAASAQSPRRGDYRGTGDGAVVRLHVSRYAGAPAVEDPSVKMGGCHPSWSGPPEPVSGDGRFQTKLAITSYVVKIRGRFTSPTRFRGHVRFQDGLMNCVGGTATAALHGGRAQK